MKKRSTLLFRLTFIFATFGIIIFAMSMLATYFIQMSTYKKTSMDRVKKADQYIVSMLLDDKEDVKEYAKFFRDHYDEIRVEPIEFDEFISSRNEFYKAFAERFPGQGFGTDIKTADLPYDLKLLYYSYYHKYWEITFEDAAAELDVAYSYFLLADPETKQLIYLIDPIREPNEEDGTKLNLGWNDIYDEPEYDSVWTVYEAGVPLDDELVIFDNEYGHTYAYYYPLIIDGEKIGLIVSEIDIDGLNKDILNRSLTLGIWVAIIFVLCEMIMLFLVNKLYISKLHFLIEEIGRFGSSRDAEIVDEIKNTKFGKDELGQLADNTSYMMNEIVEHEDEMEKASQMKSDFLANMSHEIRTPMNAVIGMAELALREERLVNVHDYIGQIKSSGRLLLAIINDVLDFSKIESGKLDIIEVNYIPASMFNDVSNIVLMKLTNGNVNFDLNIPADLPSCLYGDNIRIRQILINLVGNAIKFTNSGKISVDVSFNKTSDSEIMLKIAVEDTGIGIKEEDLQKIFDSFSQVDAKRNRSVEGTGLGLAITQRLVSLMNGTLDVKSTYGKGSVFSIEIPQKIIDPAPGVWIKDAESIVGIACFSDEYTTGVFERDSARLNVETESMSRGDNFSVRFDVIKRSHEGKRLVIFTDEDSIDMIPGDIAAPGGEADIVLVTGFTPRTDIDIKSFVSIRKPVSTLSLSTVYNRCGSDTMKVSSSDDSEFIAPTAKVLIVDDNAVNLTVAEGLLEPLKMSVMTAASGREAVELTSKYKYDIVFMDHMMPEMDGIEATHLIREKNPDYNDIPIIALTANAVGDAREMFEREGMDGFVAKPIEVRNFYSTVRHFLPEEKIETVQPGSGSGGSSSDNDSMQGELVIGDLNVASAVEMLGSRKVYLDVLKKYYNVMESKAEVISDAFAAEKWDEYTIEVHALKSSSRQIGAGELALKAEKLEMAGKTSDIDYIRANTDDLLKHYASYRPVLAEFFGDKVREDIAPSEELPVQVLKEILDKVSAAAEDLDMDAMEEASGRIDSYHYEGKMKELTGSLIKAISEMDVDVCTEIISEIRSVY